MRDIKFRIWNTDKNFMSLPDLSDDWVMCDGTINHRNQPLFPIMQFSGLPDIKLKDIYEGDIVKAFGKNYEVVFSDGAFYMKLKTINHRLSRVFIIKEEIIIVGNIYENPELLLPDKPTNEEVQETYQY